MQLASLPMTSPAPRILPASRAQRHADGATEWRADPRYSADQRGGGHQPEKPALPGGNGRQPVAGGPALRRPVLPQFYFKYCSTFDSTAQGNIGSGAGCPAGRAG